MLLRVSVFLLTAAGFAAELPHHVISPRASTKASPADAAWSYTRERVTAAGFDPVTLGSLYVAKQYRTQHNGVTHTIYQQQYQGIDVYGAEWVVNVDANGEILNAGGQLYQPPSSPWQPAAQGNRRAATMALRLRNPDLASSTVSDLGPEGTSPLRSNRATRYRAGAKQLAEAEAHTVWFPVRGRLEPAFLVYVRDEDQIEAEQIVVAADADMVLARSPLTFHQAPAAPRGLVYTGRSPQPTPQPGTKLEGEPPYVQRELVSFAGDPVASPRGWLSGTATVGNNAVVGINSLGIAFIEPEITSSASRDFQFPLELGTGAPHPTTFRDAANSNLFYWVNRVHDFFHSIGFDEAAGNYQQENFGRGGVGGDPLYAYAHYGSAGPGLASLNNAFYTTRLVSDGGKAQIAMFLGTSPGRWADGAYSTETIVHEYTHGVSLRLMRGLSGFQGGAMGEAFSDFFALEFLTPEGAPPDGIYPYGEYLYNTFGVGIRSRPYSTNMEVNPLTYRDLGRATNFISVHNDGGIWMMSLWEMRANMIRQFGEREGRRRLRLNVIDGMKLAPPASSMVDARDAILLADRVNFKGESQQQIWAAFAKRGLGVLAYSRVSDTIVVNASFETPSRTGVLAFGPEQPGVGEPIQIRLYDENLTTESAQVQVTSSSGDLETVSLRRQGSTWIGTLLSTPVATANESGALSILTGDAISAYYNDFDTGAGFRQVTKTTTPLGAYTPVTSTGLRYEFAGERALGFRRTANFTLGFPLPFEFPYFDRKVRQVTLSPAGTIAFDVASQPSCFDRTAAASIMGVSPMWAWLRTDGTAQPNEDVYVSQTAESITFRWVAETSPFASGAFGFVPEPVNFATTLFADGRIRFQYGESGNTNVVNSQPFTGCEPGLPTVGISRGHGVTGVFPISHQARSNFRTAPSLEFWPAYGNSSLPVVVLEAPAPNSKSPSLMEVRGIASDEQTGFNTVNILIDGTYRARAGTGLPRADYCANNRLPGCPNVGFATTLDLAALGIAPGAHTLQLRVANLRGGFTDSAVVNFEVEAGASALPGGRIDAPAAGATVRGAIAVSGIAYGRGNVRASFVELLIDGINYGRANYGAQQAAACAAGGEAAGSPNCPGVGFLIPLNTATGVPTLTNGEHRMQIRVGDALGRLTTLPAQTFVVDNPPNQPPDGAMTAPLNLERLSGTIRITGHAYDADGRVTNVLVLVDGVARVAARYGLPRPEVCGGLTGVTACPNIGFEAEFDTRQLPNGLHRIGVVLLDDRGAQVTIPRTTSGGVNVYFEN